MILFGKLPREIIYQILLEAVRVRGTKRAQRLRFVSRAWKNAVDEAIVQLGEFASWPDDWADENPHDWADENPHNWPFYWPDRLHYKWNCEGRPEFERAPYWPEYAVRAALYHRPPGNPETPRLLRQVAERIARYSNPDTYSNAVLKEYIMEICKMPLVMGAEAKRLPSCYPADPWFTKHYLCVPWVEEAGYDLRYNYFLLCAAAWTNHVGLVEETLQSIPPGIHPDFTRDAFNQAFRLAAYKDGNNPTTRWLYDAYKKDGGFDHAQGVVLEQASKANNLSMVEQFICPKWDGLSLGCAVFRTTSLEVFQRLYPRARRLIEENCIGPGTLGLLFESMALQGAVSILDCLFSLYFPDPASRCTGWPPGARGAGEVLVAAAWFGQAEVVAYLLEQGFPVLPAALEAAVRHGNSSPGIPAPQSCQKG
ncbi:hypothetical protein PG997_015324 [Apiospora hydei]|uniref:F-box domain-containing protein n=1 Tax=Apiospora hydei TaxID=1337664 RepID=A0ABR1UQC0_9PEZI